MGAILQQSVYYLHAMKQDGVLLLILLTVACSHLTVDIGISTRRSTNTYVLLMLQVSSISLCFVLCLCIIILVLCVASLPCACEYNACIVLVLTYHVLVKCCSKNQALFYAEVAVCGLYSSLSLILLSDDRICHLSVICDPETSNDMT